VRIEHRLTRSTWASSNCSRTSQPVSTRTRWAADCRQYPRAAKSIAGAGSSIFGAGAPVPADARYPPENRNQDRRRSARRQPSRVRLGEQPAEIGGRLGRQALKFDAANSSRKRSAVCRTARSLDSAMRDGLVRRVGFDQVAVGRDDWRLPDSAFLKVMMPKRYAAQRQSPPGQFGPAVKQCSTNGSSPPGFVRNPMVSASARRCDHQAAR
jgi:hypothetical protein